MPCIHVPLEQLVPLADLGQDRERLRTEAPAVDLPVAAGCLGLRARIENAAHGRGENTTGPLAANKGARLAIGRAAALLAESYRNIHRDHPGRPVRVEKSLGVGVQRMHQPAPAPPYGDPSAAGAIDADASLELLHASPPGTGHRTTQPPTHACVHTNSQGSPVGCSPPAEKTRAGCSRTPAPISSGVAAAQPHLL